MRYLLFVSCFLFTSLAFAQANISEEESPVLEEPIEVVEQESEPEEEIDFNAPEPEPEDQGQ